MKKIILIVLAMFCTIFAGCRPNSGNKFYDTTPESYYYQYSGMMAYPIVSYEVKAAEDGTITLSYSKDGPDVTIYKAPADLLQKIGETVREYKLYKLKRSYQPSMEILDGYGWSIAIAYGEDAIFSGGSNAWPDSKLSEGINKINVMLQSLVDNAGQDDIIGHDSLSR